MKKSIKKMLENKKFFSKALPVALIIILGLIAFFSFSGGEKTMKESEVILKSERFINDFLMDGGTAKVVSAKKEYGLFKVQVDVGTSIVDSYITKDGKLFFPQALNIEEIYNETGGAENGGASAPVAVVDVKSDKPVVELFVMSHCSYGTQMEKGILPVVEALGDKIDFQLKFNSYAMHDKIELDEQMLQYCIIQEKPELLTKYLGCFLVDGDTERCLSETGIARASLSSCITNTDKEFSITSNFENKVAYQGSFPSFNIFKTDNEKYGVQGSPTLVINGQTVSANRDSASLLSVVCSAFTSQPEACNTVLPSSSPTPGFGTGTTVSSNSDAACY